MAGSVVASKLIRQFGPFTGVDARVFIAAFVALSVVAGAVLAWHARRLLRERMPIAVANVVVTFSYAVFLALAGVTWLFLWDEVNTSLVILGDVLNRMELKAMESEMIQVGLSVLTLLVAYAITGFIYEAIERFAKRRQAFTQHQAQAFYRIAQISVYAVACMFILGFWNENLTGLLVGAGFLGIVVGMAARQTLGALLAGLVLMFSRPFEIGDWVAVDEYEGIVTDISIVNTRIQTFDGEYVMIPNDTVSGDAIVNRSRKGRLRLEVDVGVDYNAEVERASELAEDAMKGVEDVLSVPTPQVVSKEFGDSAIVLGLRFWIDKPSARRKWRARTAVIGAVKRAYDEADMKIPFPQRELTGREEANGFRVTGRRQQVRTTGEGQSTADDRTAHEERRTTADGGTDDETRNETTGTTGDETDQTEGRDSSEDGAEGRGSNETGGE